MENLDLKLMKNYLDLKFPEKPGALLNFLNKMKKDWDITLFHYRNHGSAFGRVLVGIDIEIIRKKTLIIF